MTTLGNIDPGYTSTDDLRHWPAPDGKMRDSLFWEMIMPDEQIGMQVYLYVTHKGWAGYNVMVWGPGDQPLISKLASGKVPDTMDFDNFSFEGLTVVQPELRRTARITFESEDFSLDYDFTAIHDAFSYHQNPDGLPSWFALNRLEQTGRVTGFMDIKGRRIELNRMGHRDHSWGTRNWGVPHHWKWIIAYTESGRAINIWIWIAKGEWGFGGYVVRDGITIPISHVKSHSDYDDDMTQRRFEADVYDITGGVTRLEMERFGIFRLPSNDRMATVITEAACSATIDGETGAGQFETHWPAEYLQHLIEAGA